ncbi:MAG: DUF1761 domain-containing protein [Chloroflexi bacterium]|nr:DUF1761 domain-containing protein [Chloroflexota bacterium]
MLALDINWIAVIVAAVASMVIGFVYYHPAVLGKRWQELIGRQMDPGSVGLAYAYTAVGALIAAFVIAQFVHWSDSYTIGGGAFIGALGWLGFTATASFADFLFSGRPWPLFSIQNGYQLVSFVVMGAIVGALPPALNS